MKCIIARGTRGVKKSAAKKNNCISSLQRAMASCLGPREGCIICNAVIKSTRSAEPAGQWAASSSGGTATKKNKSQLTIDGGSHLPPSSSAKVARDANIRQPARRRRMHAKSASKCCSPPRSRALSPALALCHYRIIGCVCLCLLTYLLAYLRTGSGLARVGTAASEKRNCNAASPTIFGPNCVSEICLVNARVTFPARAT